MKQFKKFLKENEYIEGQKKWNVVIFAGDFDPITKWEYGRIQDFVSNFIKSGDNTHLFDKNVDIGVMISEVSKDEEISSFQGHNLSLEERKFINGKFFGLRTFTVDMKKLLWSTTLQREIDSQEFKKEVFGDLFNNFESKNILIVMNPENRNNLNSLEEIQKTYEDDNVTIGFVNWSGREQGYIKTKELRTLNKSGDMIKAICLLDFYKPDPKDLKYFAHKYNLSHILHDIKSIHFMVGNERYLDAFKALFPSLSIYNNDDDALFHNFKFVFELLKKMYLDDEYETIDEEVLGEKEEDMGDTDTGGGEDEGGEEDLEL